MKKSIKKLLDQGTTITVDYKQKINSWFSEISIYKHKDSVIVGEKRLQFYDIDDGINYFMEQAYSSKNKGLIQRRLDQKGLVNSGDEYSFENPNKKMRDLFKKEGILMDKELEKLNIKSKPFPKLSDAKKEFKKVKDIEKLEDVQKFLMYLKKKYTLLDLYLFGYEDYEYNNDRGEKDTGTNMIELEYITKTHLDISRDYSRYNSDYYQNIKSLGFSVVLVSRHNNQDRTQIKLKF